MSECQTWKTRICSGSTISVTWWLNYFSICCHLQKRKLAQYCNILPSKKYLNRQKFAKFGHTVDDIKKIFRVGVKISSAMSFSKMQLNVGEMLIALAFAIWYHKMLPTTLPKSMDTAFPIFASVAAMGHKCSLTNC